MSAASAHSRNAASVRHDLIAHLRGVSEMAAAFGSAFGAADLARSAGLFHDLGKFHPDFQAYLAWCEEHPGKRGPRVDHKAAGAIAGARRNALLPLLIMAHHGGLRMPAELRAWIKDAEVVQRGEHTLALANAALPELTTDPQTITMPGTITSRTDAELYTRMVFSCLIDADYLDTEAHFNADTSAERGAEFDPGALLGRLRRYRDSLGPGHSDVVATIRRDVAAACERAGEFPPGVYRMTVPTGGGKTIAGMAFALRHAEIHGKHRVIVAIPYTSITEQTAAVYRAAFGDGMVLEHHSAARHDVTEEADGKFGRADVWQRLAAENWDAPVVVTTTVQIFESLLGHRVGTSRKLHNLANSVLILDEVQMLPPKFLGPILDVLRGLAEHFGLTVLLSTATQPDFIHPAFRDIPEIAPDPARTFAALRRVEYVVADGQWSWSDAADAVRRQHQAMAIVNTKKDARLLLAALADDRALHLSTMLCGAHRRVVLAEVRRRLHAGEPCLLVTTQVVEAGVDLDFPAVFRAMGPLDRIIQAGGRCNREGRLHHGTVRVFRPAEGGMPQGAYRTATQITARFLREGSLDLDNSSTVGPYFSELYATVDTDAEEIQTLRAAMDFHEVSRRFRMIDDDTADVIVPYRDDARASVDAAVHALRTKDGSARTLLRTIQPYTVGLRKRDLDAAAARGLVAPVIEGVWEWVGPPDRYDDIRGLLLDGVDDELLLA